eukprot:Colp12_sorted_trinity150504_noHs@6891
MRVVMANKVLLAAVVAACLCLVQGAPTNVTEHLIRNLPGLDNKLMFDQYAGYINVDVASNRNLFYWLTESQSNPSKDPVLLWLNGGPGCSSLGGFFTELGPFFPTEGGKSLILNPYAWNNKANVIFLESPAGVGFSYSDNQADYTVGDKRTADDAVKFLIGFYERYPHFKSNPLYISGESYAGHYVPNLAKAIIESNEAGLTSFNFRGFLVGNAWTIPAKDNLGSAQMWLSHHLISQSTFDGLNTTCNFTVEGPIMMQKNKGMTCEDWQIKAHDEMGRINIYSIYADVCTTTADRQARRLMKALSSDTNNKLSTLYKLRASKPVDICVEDFTDAYLNRQDVQDTLKVHIRSWDQCSDDINYSHSDLLTPMIPVYEFLLKHNLKMLVYSGDMDGIVPTTGTRLWLPLLNLPLKETWRPWLVSNQVAGYVEKYEGLTFATVRGAGHMVPGDQPERAYALLERFLEDTEL